MWLGACASSIGTWMQMAAQNWLVYDLTIDPRYQGWDRFLSEIPIVLLSLFGGVLADRMNRRHILLGSQVLQMICATLLTVLLYTSFISKETPRVWPILAVSFVVGIAQAFGGPAYSALVPSLVEKEHLKNAISLNSIQFNLARVIGPTLSGIALKSFGAVWCFGLNALSYVAVIVSLIVVRPRFVPAATKLGVFESMRQGIDFIRNRAGMVPLIGLTFMMTFLGVSMLQFLNIFTREILHKDAGTFTALMSVSGLGSVAGALLVAGSAQKRGLIRYSLVSIAALGLLTLGFAYSRTMSISFVLVFFAGAALISSFALVMSTVQAVVPDEMRGRVMSVYNLALRGGMPIGSLIAGYLIKDFSLPTVLAWNGILLVALAIYFWMVHRNVATM